MSGIEKEIDNLGRVVIPIKFRKKLGLEPGNTVVLSIDEAVITISPQNRVCALCSETIGASLKFRLCSKYVLKIKSE